LKILKRFSSSSTSGSVSKSSDDVLRRAFTFQREERRRLGLQAAFEAEINSLLIDLNRGEQKVTGVTAEAAAPIIYERKVDTKGWANGTGRRKSAIAEVWIKEGTGLNLTIKRQGDKTHKLLVDYFDQFQLARAIEPFKVVEKIGIFDAKIIVHGGGMMGQAGAISLGFARALQAFNPDFRATLKAAGLMKRDARVVERKKPGQKKARKKFQWVKR